MALLINLRHLERNDLKLVGDVLEAAEREHGALEAVGHRIVHGGRAFFAPVVIDARTLSDIAALAPLAPLYQPHNVMGVRAVAELRPGLRQVACFDTAFHRTQPELNRRLPLPESYFADGVERYGFHGLSYTWLAQQIARLRGGVPKRMLAFHLGAGSSAWVSVGNTPARATVEAKLAAPEYKVEIAVIAAK